jgi:hypothetical protein
MIGGVAFALTIRGLPMTRVEGAVSVTRGLG